MTAVQFLETIIKHCERFGTNVEQKDIEEALKMEREQHSKTWDAALDKYEARAGNYMRAYEDFDDYYEQFKNK
jgi:hypothetical protein